MRRSVVSLSHRKEETMLSLVAKSRRQRRHTAYEVMVSVIQQQFRSQPMEVLCGATDEVLTILKNDKTKNPYNPISNQMFNQFVSMAAEAASS
ncbi:hypothetical protein QYE76_067927 [Lolium multiflorum]|uniref:Uncharacterized protein n=1 Tax=Lolium multiflorum TaxID=4521 RepID=A0AAD8SDG9_LOLMU|nr:hypothetical protein QYE76_067927 [Lolium multiflorum]